MTQMAQRPKQTNKYWEKRLKQEQAYMNKATNTDDIVRRYDLVIDDITRKIESEYARLELRGFERSVVETADIGAYEREAKELVAYTNKMRDKLGRNAAKTDFTAEVNRRMKVYNATMRINRLEYLKSQVALSLVKAGIDTDVDLQQELSDKYVAEKARQAGILASTVVPMSHTKLFKIVAAQVNGANFSQRIWHNTDSLKAELDVLLTNNIIQGQNSNVIARRLRSLLNGQYKDNTKYITERLARTEFTRVIGQAQKDSYHENDIEHVKWMAESSACSYCVAASKDGLRGEGVYEIDHEPNYPQHPQCRCSLAAYYE